MLPLCDLQARTHIVNAVKDTGTGGLSGQPLGGIPDLTSDREEELNAQGIFPGLQTAVK